MFTGGVAQRLRHTLGKRTGAIPRRFESCLLRHWLQNYYRVIQVIRSITKARSD